jgi:hypothetical protein
VNKPTDAQLRRLFGLYQEAGITDRAERLAHMRRVLDDRNLGSASELSEGQVSELIGALEETRDGCSSARPRRSRSGDTTFSPHSPVAADQIAMPRAPLICAASGCGRAATRRGRCAKHQQRASGRQWRRLRAQAAHARVAAARPVVDAVPRSARITSSRSRKEAPSFRRSMSCSRSAPSVTATSPRGVAGDPIERSSRTEGRAR